MVRHQGADAYQKLVEHLDGAAGELIVVLVGPVSRTWYKDIAQIRLTLSDLRDICQFSVVHGGKFPFDMYVEQFCRELGIPCFLSGPESREVRLTQKYERDSDLAYGASLVVAFPAEEPSGNEGPRARAKHYPPESADLGVVRGARELGVPVFSIYRDGWALWEPYEE